MNNAFGSTTELASLRLFTCGLHSLQRWCSGIHFLTGVLKLSMELAYFNFSGKITEIFGPK